jgi:DNA repair photolyase
MPKKDIRSIKFKSIVGWRGDSLVCNQAFGGDIFAGCSMGCWWCFCCETAEELYTKYYDGWSRDLVRPSEPIFFKKLFDKAFGSDKKTNDWTIECLRYGLPFNMGSKSEVFCIEDREENIVVPILKLFREYNVPVIFETKSQFIGMRRYLDIIKDLNCAIIVSILGGTDTLNAVLEPFAPPPSMRWAMVRELTDMGLWVGVRWEPILPGINSSDEVLEDYVNRCLINKAKHISMFNYRTSNARIAKEQFESRGFNYIKMLKGNLDENWRPIGQKFFNCAKAKGVPISTPDVVNFPFDSDCISCCGVDGLFKPYLLNLQYLLHLIKTKGFVSWDDVEEIEFKEPKAFERLKGMWNKKGGMYYSIGDCRGVKVLDVDHNGFNIYGRSEEKKKLNRKKGLLY